MGIGTSSLKGAPIADIGAGPGEPLAPKKPSFLSQWPAEANAPATSEKPRRNSKKTKDQLGSSPPAERRSSFLSRSPVEAAGSPAIPEYTRRNSKAPYRDPSEVEAEQNYPHEKYHPGAEHARYRAEQKRNSLSRYHSGDEHAKYRSEQAQEHAKHEAERKQRRANEGLSDEQTGFISSADQAAGYRQTEVTKPQGMKAKILEKFNSGGDGSRRRISDAEMIKYTGKTTEELLQQGKMQASGRVPDQLSTWANVRGGAL